MRTRVLPFLALLCLALAGMLCIGYGVQSTADVGVPRANGNRTAFILQLGEGRAILYFQDGKTTAKLRGPVAWHTSFNRRPPDLRRSLAEFDAHRLPIAGVTTSWIFACPIWCLLLPCLVPPVVWWRSRRRSVEVRGFELNQMNLGPTPFEEIPPSGFSSDLTRITTR